MMRDAIEMWRSPRLVVLTAVSAAVYAAVLMPFKVLVIFPGLAEVRPATVFPIVFSLLFGPAGAWGAAFGNLMGDALGGMLGPGSLFGFAANFAYGYIPYKLWEALGGKKDVGEELTGWREKIPGWLYEPAKVGILIAFFFVASLAAVYGGHRAGRWDLVSLVKWKWGGKEFHAGLVAALLALSVLSTLGLTSVLFLVFSPRRLVAVILVAALACAGILGWGIEALGFFPFRVFASWILFNNLLISLILAPPLLLILQPRVAKRFMLYRDLLPEHRKTPRTAKLGALITVLAVLSLFAAGTMLSSDAMADLLGLSPQLAKGVALSPLVLALFLGLALL